MPTPRMPFRTTTRPVTTTITPTTTSSRDQGAWPSHGVEGVRLTVPPWTSLDFLGLQSHGQPPDHFTLKIHYRSRGRALRSVARLGLLFLAAFCFPEWDQMCSLGWSLFFGLMFFRVVRFFGGFVELGCFGIEGFFLFWVGAGFG